MYEKTIAKNRNHYNLYFPFLVPYRLFSQSNLRKRCRPGLRFKSFSSFDMLMTIAPAFLITISCLIINSIAMIYAAFHNPIFISKIFGSLVYTIVSAYLLLFVVGLATGISEWKNIRCSTARKISSFFTFPLFMMTYIPISIQALFVKVEWKPIEHNVAISMEELTQINR